ncbi:Uncharacterised protein [Escherichia coli]|nr:Uncharacterised protein [Escherichia coli]
MHMKNQESVLKVSVLLSDEQNIAASTVDVKVLLILEIALEERRAFTHCHAVFSSVRWPQQH